LIEVIKENQPIIDK